MPVWSINTTYTMQGFESITTVTSRHRVLLGMHTIYGPSMGIQNYKLKGYNSLSSFTKGQWIGRKAFCSKRRSGDSNTLRVSAAVAPPTIQKPSEESEQDDRRGEFGQGFEPSEGVVEESGKFVWKDHWYPVSLIEDLDPKSATAFQLLGREIALWQDADGNWRAFEDKCPHRLAPLSEGRLDENGWLQCSYHGWSFKADGSCGRIPQAASEGPEARAVRSPRACAVSFPTIVSQGLLFVWPDENGWEKASKFKPPMLPSAFNDSRFSTVTIQRDLFYGYDTLMENVSDPSHIDFAHHKVRIGFTIPVFAF
eukprot:Gb_37385 [translate_table: standard]